jgi:acetyl-CoA synthetase
VLKQGFIATPELRAELKAHLRKTMGAIVASDVDILIVDSVPKTRSGKIMRRLLKAVVSGETLGDVTTLEDGVAIEDAKKSFDMLKSSIETSSSS